MSRPAPAAVQAWLVGLSPGTTIAMFDGVPDARPPRGQIDGLLDGAPLPRPVVSSRLALRNGGWRGLVLLRRPSDQLARSHLDLLRDGVRMAFVDPTWLQSPLRDAEDLIDGLAPAAVPRFLRFLLSAIATLVPREETAAFTRVLLRLLARLDVPQASPMAIVPVGRAGSIHSIRLPASVAMIGDSAIRLGPAGAEVMPQLALLREGASLLHLFLPRDDRAPATDLVLLGQAPLHLSMATRTPRRMDLSGWLDRSPPDVRDWAEGILRDLAPRDQIAAAALAERAIAPADGPVLTRAMVARTRGGLLVWADVTDPGRIAARLQVGSGSSALDLDIPPDGRIRAFCPVPPGDHRPGAEVGLRLVGRSGRSLASATAPVAPFTGDTPAGFDAVGDAAACRSFAAAWGDRAAAPLPVTVASAQDCATGLPDLTLTVQLIPDPDMIRARAALVAAEPPGHRVEIDLVHTGQPSARLLQLVEDTARTYGVAHRVLVVADRIAPVDGLLAAIGAARAPRLLSLGAAVLPDGPGWLAPLLDALANLGATGLLGGTLLDHDRAVIHAGGRIGLDPRSGAPRIEMTARGLPVGDLGPAPLLRSDLFTPEAVAITAAGRDALRRAGPCLPDPELVLLPALLTAGAGQVARDLRFMRFGPATAPDPFARTVALHLLSAAPESPATDASAPDTPATDRADHAAALDHRAA